MEQHRLVRPATNVGLQDRPVTEIQELHEAVPAEYEGSRPKPGRGQFAGRVCNRFLPGRLPVKRWSCRASSAFGLKGQEIAGQGGGGIRSMAIKFIDLRAPCTLLRKNLGKHLLYATSVSLLIPTKVGGDSDLIPVTRSDAMPVRFGAK